MHAVVNVQQVIIVVLAALLQRQHHAQQVPSVLQVVGLQLLVRLVRIVLLVSAPPHFVLLARMAAQQD